MSLAPADPPTPPWPEMVDDLDLAKALGTSVQRVRSMAKRGELPRPLNDGRRMRWARQRLISHLTGESPAGSEG